MSYLNKRFPEITPRKSSGPAICLLMAAVFLFLGPRSGFSQSFSASEYKKLGPFGDYVWDVQFSPSGDYVAFTAGDNYIYLYDRYFNQVWSHQGNSSSFAGSCTFTPDGQYLIFARYQTETDIAVLRLSDKQVVQRLTDNSAKVSSVSISQNGMYLSSSTTDGNIRLWKKSGSNFYHQSSTNPHSGWINEISLSPDNQYLASGAMSGAFKIQKVSGDYLYEGQTPVTGESGQTYSVAFSPDGNYLVAGCGKTPKIWQKSGSSWNLMQSLSDGSGWVWDVVFSPDGKYIASASGSSEIKIWKKSGSSFYAEKTLYGHSSGVNTLNFSPDGKYLASGSSDKTVRIWSLSGVSGASGGYAAGSGSGKVLFQDDFSNNYNDWAEQDDGTVYLKVQYGLYYVRDENSMRKTWKSIDINQYEDFRIEALIQKVDGLNNNSYGIFWGGDDNNNYYLFSVSGDGHFLHAAYSGGSWEYIVNWTKSEAINKYNATNKLAVQKSGNQLQLFINDTYVTQAPFRSFYGDFVGFAAASKIKMAADNIVVTQGGSAGGGSYSSGGFSESDHFDNALSYMNAQNYESAVSELLSVIQKNSSNVDAYTNLGISYLNLGNYDNAIYYSQKAVDLKPDFADPYNTLGIAYTYKKDYSQGILFFRQHFGMATDKSLSAYNLACCYSLQNQVDEALMWLEEALKAGYTDYNWIEQDGDLQNIRYHPKFNDILSRYKGGRY